MSSSGSDERIKTVKLSERDAMIKRGFQVYEGGDAAKASSDGFQLMVKRKEGRPTEWCILCPTYLRGPLFLGEGAASY